MAMRGRPRDEGTGPGREELDPGYRGAGEARAARGLWGTSTACPGPAHQTPSHLLPRSSAQTPMGECANGCGAPRGASAVLLGWQWGHVLDVLCEEGLGFVPLSSPCCPPACW